MREAEKMGNHSSNAGRRQALKSLACGISAIAAYNLLPAQWSKPLIESVMLPAHAETSGSTGGSGYMLSDPCEVTIIDGDQGTESIEARVDGFVTPATGGLVTTIDFVPVGSGEPITLTATTAANGTFSGTAIITAGPTAIITLNVTTTVAGAVDSSSCAVAVPEPEGPVCSDETYYLFPLNTQYRGYRCLSDGAFFTVAALGRIYPAPSAEDFASGCIEITLTATAQGVGTSTSDPTSPVAPESLSAVVTPDSNGYYHKEFIFEGVGAGEVVEFTATSPKTRNMAAGQRTLPTGLSCS